MTRPLLICARETLEMTFSARRPGMSRSSAALDYTAGVVPSSVTVSIEAKSAARAKGFAAAIISYCLVSSAHWARMKASV